MLRLRLVVLGALWVTLAACAGPVTVIRVDRTIAHRDLSRSAITMGEPSWPTREVLFEQGLFEILGKRLSGDETADVWIDLGTPVVEASGAGARSRFTERTPRVTIEVRDASAVADAAVHRARTDVAQHTK